MLILHLINGITLGTMYAMVAIGLTLIFGVARLVNFAHGELFMIGGYILIWLYIDHDVPYGFAILLVVLFMALFGIGFERIIVRPVLEKSWRVQLIATLAASIVFINLAIRIWGTLPKSAPTKFSMNILTFGQIRIAEQRLLLLGVAVVSFVALALFIRYTKMGKAMRAVSQNREACIVYGINVQRVSVVTFAIGSGMAGLGAGLITPLYQIWPTVGSFLILKALAAVVIGGFGNPFGTIVAALFIGIVESLFAGYVSFQYKDAAAFVALILVLLLKPEGLFHKKVGI